MIGIGIVRAPLDQIAHHNRMIGIRRARRGKVELRTIGSLAEFWNAFAPAICEPRPKRLFIGQSVCRFKFLGEAQGIGSGEPVASKAMTKRQYRRIISCASIKRAHLLLDLGITAVVAIVVAATALKSVFDGRNFASVACVLRLCGNRSQPDQQRYQKSAQAHSHSIVPGGFDV